MKNLIDALEKFISLVDPEKGYIMSSYNLCIIGKTVGWNVDGQFKSNVAIERNVLTTHFGITANPKLGAGYFSHEASSRYSEIEWKVIRLFTVAVVYDSVSHFGVDGVEQFYNSNKYIRGKDWLKIANEVLTELKEQNV